MSIFIRFQKRDFFHNSIKVLVLVYKFPGQKKFGGFYQKTSFWGLFTFYKLRQSNTLNFYLTKSRFGILNPDLVTQNTHFVTQNCQKIFADPRWNFVHENEIS